MTGLAFEPALSRPRHRLLIVFACLIVLAGAIFWGVTRVTEGLGKGLGTAIGQVISESGGFAAGRAAYVADSRGVALGTVTAAQMRLQDRSERWIPGTVAVTGENQVSFAAAGDHLTTATEGVTGGPCSYGLAVGSTGDPIAAADGLPGPGVYMNFSMPNSGTSCAADQAPTSGWTKVSRTDLFQAGVPVYPRS